MEIRARIGRNLRQIREEKGYSQEDLAFRSGLHRTYVSGVERGIRNPTVTVLEKLANALEVPMADLVA